MKHTYNVDGMTCSGCEAKVKEDLSKVENITEVQVSKDDKLATLTMSKHVELSVLQEALGGIDGKYQISVPNANAKTDEKAGSCCATDKPVNSQEEHSHKDKEHSHNHNSGSYYCPMHCEGDKEYDKPGDCPMCGMDLVQQPILNHNVQYTCPMHPEIIRDEPGSCPICGMDLVPMEPSDSEENKTYEKLLHKMKIATLFTVPIFIIAMSDMIPNNPLYNIMDLEKWNWVQFILTIPVVFYACWMFFERAWKSRVN